MDSAIIIGIVVLNSLLGVIQESRAEKALEALKELSAPKARVPDFRIHACCRNDSFACAGKEVTA